MKCDVDKLPPVYWLTRDTAEGRLDDRVDVWAVRPIPYRFADGDLEWFAPDDVNVDSVDTCLGDLDLVAAAKIGTVPTGELECVRVGPGRAKASA